jgi:hypothetical protein
METMILAGAGFRSVKAAVDWANQQVGRSAPDHVNREVARIVEFQVVPEGDGFSIAMLVELEHKKSMSSMVINMRKELGLSDDEASTQE